MKASYFTRINLMVLRIIHEEKKKKKKKTVVEKVLNFIQIELELFEKTSAEVFAFCDLQRRPTHWIQNAKFRGVFQHSEFKRNLSVNVPRQAKVKVFVCLSDCLLVCLFVFACLL